MSVPKQDESHKEQAMISVLTNTASLEAQRNLANTQSALSKSISRLSSGMRINCASDDAAGLGISESLKADITSMAQAQRNSNDGISMSQVAEGGMNQMQGIVSRMRELAVQSSNRTLGANERGYIQTEFTQLGQEIDRISNVTDFAGQKLLDGSASAGLTLQVGINNTSNDRLQFKITKLATTTLGSTTLHVGSASLSTATHAQTAIGVFDTAPLISKLVSAEKSPETQYTSQQTTLSGQKSVVDALTSAVASLGSMASDLALPSTLQMRTASSSDTHISVAASGTATATVHDIRVNQIAAAQVASSNTYTGDTVGSAGAGSVKITSGTTSATVTYDATDTLSSIASKINNANAGVRASVQIEGTLYH